MAKSTLKVAYSIIEGVTNRINSDDNRIDEEWVIDKMFDIRAILIRQEFERGRLSGDFYTRKCCLEIECRDVVCNGVHSGVQEYYVELPTLVSGLGWANISYLGLVDWKTPFDRLTTSEYMSLDFNEWTHNRPSYYIINNEAIITNLPTTGTKYLCISGIFANPQTICDWDNEEDFPLPDHLIHQLELIVKKDILSSYGIPVDPINNANDDTTVGMTSKQAQQVQSQMADEQKQ